VVTDDRYVLDTFAVVALFRGEPAAARVRELLEAGGAGAALLILSLVNYGEVAYITEQRSGSQGLSTLLSVLDQLPIDIIRPDRTQALSAAHMKAAHAMSYADAYAAALAASHQATLVTGDPAFEAVEGQVRVEWLPRHGDSKRARKR
jgi:ribonuclease VapC